MIHISCHGVNSRAIHDSDSSCHADDSFGAGYEITTLYYATLRNHNIYYITDHNKIERIQTFPTKNLGPKT